MLAGELFEGISAPRSEISPYEGYGSVMNLVAQALVVAAEAGRTLALNASEWSFGPWEDFFAPLSACTPADAAAAALRDAAAPEASLSGVARLPWRLANASYLRRDEIRMLPLPGDEKQRLMVEQFFNVSVPPSVSAAGGGLREWLSAAHAYLHARMQPELEAELDATYGEPAGGDGLLVCVHARLRDRGGRLEGALAGLLRVAAAALAAAGSPPGARLLLATDGGDEEGTLAARLAAGAAAGGFAASRLLPRRVVFPAEGMPPISAAEYLSRHPHLSRDATMDALAVVHTLGTCHVIIGRPESRLLRLAVALQSARGCSVAQVAPLWSSSTGAPAQLSMQEDGMRERPRGEARWRDGARARAR